MIMTNTLAAVWIKKKFDISFINYYQKESLSVASWHIDITVSNNPKNVCRLLQVVLSFEFEWGFYAQLASEVIFRARTYTVV